MCVWYSSRRRWDSGHAGPRSLTCVCVCVTLKLLGPIAPRNSYCTVVKIRYYGFAPATKHRTHRRRELYAITHTHTHDTAIVIYRLIRSTLLLFVFSIKILLQLQLLLLTFERIVLYATVRTPSHHVRRTCTLGSGEGSGRRRPRTSGGHVNGGSRGSWKVNKVPSESSPREDSSNAAKTQ